jgi:antitoxin CptB
MPIGDAPASLDGHQADPLRRARLRWRSRRGLLENDIVLTRFLDRHEAALSDDDVGALTRLLELSDNELMDLILARCELEPALDEPATRHVVALLRSA